MSKAVPAKVYPTAQMTAVETVLSTVSETCASTAHRFYCGLQQLWNRSKDMLFVKIRQRIRELRAPVSIEYLVAENYSCNRNCTGLSGRNEIGTLSPMEACRKRAMDCA